MLREESVKTIKIGIQDMVFRPMCPKIEDALKTINKAGYKFVELSLGFGRYLGLRPTEEKISTTKELLRKCDLEVCGINDIEELSHHDEEKRKAAVKNIENTIKVAKTFGCNMVTSELPPSRRTEKTLDDPNVAQKCKEAFKKSISELCPALIREGVHLTVECHPGDWIEDSDRTVDMIRETGCRNLGYLYVCQHTFLLGIENPPAKNLQEAYMPVRRKNAEDMLRYAGKTLNYLYVADTFTPEKMISPQWISMDFKLLDRFKREIHQHLVPGKGEVDFKSVLKALKEIEYDGFLVVQIFGYGDKALRAAIDSRKFLGKLLS